MLQKPLVPFLLGCIAFQAGTAAYGTIIPRATLVANPPAVPFLAPEAELPAPWRSYQLSLESTAGELIGAVDVEITGPLHQRWAANFIILPSPVGPPSNGRGDSHLNPPSGSPFGAGPSESNSGMGSPLTSIPGEREYGLGGLRGAWGILDPQPVTNLAYIVFRSDQLDQVQISVLSASPTGRYPDFVTADFFPIPIPEPASIVVAVCALVALSACRPRLRIH